MLLYILEEPETLAEWGRNLGDASRLLVEDPNDILLCNWMSVLPRLQPYISPFEILSVFMKEKVNLKILVLRYLPFRYNMSLRG